jgi:CAAX prenyl protease-like protein
VTSERSERGVGRAEGHGWWPYLLPYFGFGIAIEVSNRVPDAWGPFMLAVKAVVPGALILFFFVRGRYPELRGDAGGGAALGLDVLVGLASAVMWVAPYLLLPSLAPDVEGFDPEQAGASLAPLVLGLRMLGYAAVTPFMEELFLRSFLMRYSDVFDESADFRDVPIGRFTWRSFLVVCIGFTLTHQPWEWPVAVPWIVLTTLWFYRRRHLMAMVVVHAVANASILLFVMAASGAFRDADGNPLSLWFFV